MSKNITMPMRRTLKNVVKNYTEAQVKVREATSNDPWGPSSTLMSEIADLTYNVVAFTEIMQMIWKRLNDHGKNWRHVYKSLVVLDYIIKTGSEKVAQQCKENIYLIQTLKDFQYIEDNKDQGMNVREKAKQLVALLKDDERLKNERAKSLKAKERFALNAMGVGNSKISRSGSASSPELQSGGYSDSADGIRSSPTRRRERRLSSEIENVRPSSLGEEELQLQLALAMSREEHEEEQRKMKSDDIKLQMAIDESRKVQEEPGTGQPTLQGLADQSRQKQQTDPWGAPLNSQATADPWGAPLPGPPGSAHKHHQPTQQPPPPSYEAATDPWGSPVRQPAPQAQAPADPWSSPSQPAQKVQSDPWGAPVSNQAEASPWGPAPVPGSTAGVTTSFNPSPTTNGNIDDDFDILSSRTSPSKLQGTGQPIDAFDPLAGEPKPDPWNMDGMGSALTGDKQKQRKTPQEFLGANSNLVNLDNLVKTDPTSKQAKNPFASTSPNSTNPFEQPTQRVPLSQLQTSTYNSGFSQPVSQGLLPAPMAPMSMPPPMQPQQGYNPFL